jgi:hypothetical protein
MKTIIMTARRVTVAPVLRMRMKPTYSLCIQPRFTPASVRKSFRRSLCCISVRNWLTNLAARPAGRQAYLPAVLGGILGFPGSMFAVRGLKRHGEGA